MDSWEGIISKLEALLATPPETVEEQASQLAEILQAMKAMMDTASADVATEAEVEAAEKGYEKASAIVAKIDKKINAKIAALQAKSVLDARVYGQTQGKGAPSPFKVPDGAVITLGKAYRGKYFVKADGSPDGLGAYRAAQHLFALHGRASSRKWCEENGMQFKSLVEGTDALGGYLVSEELDKAILFRREASGQMRKLVGVTSISSDELVQYVNDGGVTVYATAELEEMTLSDIRFSPQRTRVGKYTAFSKWSDELGEDSWANIVDELAKEHGYQHARKEDNLIVNAAGEATYHNQVGVLYAYQKLVVDMGGTWNTDSNKEYLASGVVGTGTTWGSLVMADFLAMPTKVRGDVSGALEWTMNPTFWWGVVVPLIQAAGGQTQQERQGGVTQFHFLGYPVNLVEAMPSGTAVNTIPVLFGDLSTAITFVDRSGLTTETSDQVAWTQGAKVTKTVARYGVGVHDIGNASATAALRTRGAAAALIVGSA